MAYSALHVPVLVETGTTMDGRMRLKASFLDQIATQRVFWLNTGRTIEQQQQEGIIMEGLPHNFTATTPEMGQMMGVICIDIPVQKSSSDVAAESVNSSSDATVKVIREGCNVIREGCNARRMGESHNGAYIERPVDNCPHGKVLVCSHLPCRTSGRRFRWCDVCRKVTTARNFSRRHSHVEILNGAPIEALTKNKVLDNVDNMLKSVIDRVVPRVDGAEILRKAGIDEVTVRGFREGEACDTQSPQKTVAEGVRYEDKKRKAEAGGATTQSFRHDFLQQGYQSGGSATGNVSHVNVVATQTPQDINNGLLKSIRSRKRSLDTDDSVTQEFLARRVKDAVSKGDASTGINHGSTMGAPADVSNPSHCNTPQIPQESMDERRHLLLGHLQQLRGMMEKQSASRRSILNESSAAPADVRNTMVNAPTTVASSTNALQLPAMIEQQGASTRSVYESSAAPADVRNTAVNDPIDTTMPSANNILQLRVMIEQQDASTRSVYESNAAPTVVPTVPVNDPIDTTSTNILQVRAMMEQQGASTRIVNEPSAAPAIVPGVHVNNTINTTVALPTNHKVMVLTEREANLIELLRTQANKSSVDYWFSQILLASEPPGVVPKRDAKPSGQEENGVLGQVQQFVQSFF